MKTLRVVYGIAAIALGVFYLLYPIDADLFSGDLLPIDIWVRLGLQYICAAIMIMFGCFLIFLYEKYPPK